MKLVWMSAVTVGVAMFLGGCSDSTATAEPVQKAESAAPQQPQMPRVEIDTEAGIFWFGAQRCHAGLDPDSGVAQFSVAGAGQAPDGQPIYVTLEDEDNDPSIGPEIHINVGVDQLFKTPELAWIGNDQVAVSQGTARPTKAPPAQRA